MKNFRFASILILAVGIIMSMPAKAQTRIVTTQVNTQGNTTLFGGSSFTTPVDSLQVTDSLAYYVPITHQNAVDPIHQWYWSKIGAGNATITLNYLQSNDGVNWFQIPFGVAKAAYTKTYSAVSASTWYMNDFKGDSAIFSGRYLKVYFITSATASVKGKLINILKTNIK